MLTRKRTLILGTGPTAERLRNAPGGSGTALRTGSDLANTGLEKSARFGGMVLCTDETDELAIVLETLGRLCKRNTRFLINPFPLTLLSAKRNPPLDLGAVLGAMQSYPLRLRVFSIPAIAARRLLRRYPLHLGADGTFGQAVHVLIGGFSDLGTAIALHAMGMAHYGSGRPRLTIASPDPEGHRNKFLSEFPEALSVAEVHFVDLDLSGLRADIPVTSVYLCDGGVSEDTVRIPRFLESLRLHQSASPPIFLKIGDATTTHDFSNWDGQTYPFSALSDVFRADILFGDSEDELALIVHDYYRDSIAAQGRPLEGNPAAEPWARLDVSYRQASRHQADHMTAKIAAIDCRIVPEQESEFFVFDPREVEKLARIEHDRWSADRHLNGWKYGPVRDNEKKIHPELIPYDELSEDMKDLDRYTVRLMPALLARKGLAIRRNLIVAVIPASNGCKPGDRCIESVDSIFRRLTDRYPDRSLVVAINLADESQRILAVRAMRKFRAALWSLIGEPLDRLLIGPGAEPHRIARLEMLAYSERRICLAGQAEIARWQRRRANVALILEQVTRQVRSLTAPEIPAAHLDQSAGFARLRQVRLDPETGFTGWSFDY
ncbi:MAG: RyR domain-containing protein [Methylococcales bacterium]